MNWDRKEYIVVLCRLKKWFGEMLAMIPVCVLPVSPRLRKSCLPNS